MQVPSNNPMLQTPGMSSFLQKILMGGRDMMGGERSLLGVNDPSIDPDAMKGINRQALLSMGAQMLANSGPSPVKQSFGSILGQSLLAGQQAQSQGTEQALKAMLIKKQLQQPAGSTPNGVAEYEYAKKNGYTGSFEEWKRIAAAKPSSPAGIQEYEYFSKLTPEQQKQFLSLQRSPVVPQFVTMAGAQGLLDRTNSDPNKAFTPITTKEQEISAAVEKARAEAEAKGIGSAVGEAKGGIEKRSLAASNVNDILDVADPLLDLSTGSASGAAADKVAAFFGKSLDGAQSAGQLKILQGALMFAQPRMEGPQGVLDVKLYEQMAGQIGDETVPRETRKAAIKTIRDLYKKYSTATPGADAPKTRRYNPATGKIE